MSLGKLFGKIGDKFDGPENPVPVIEKFPQTVQGLRSDYEGFHFFDQTDMPFRDGQEVAIYRLEKVVKASVKVG